MSIDSGSPNPFYPGDATRQHFQGRAMRASLRGLQSLSLLTMLAAPAILLVPGVTSREASRARASLQGDAGMIAELEFDPDGEAVASIGLDGAARLWGVRGPGENGGRRLNREDSLCLAFSPDGKTLATGGIGGVALCDAANPDESGRGWPSGPVRTMAFSPDGKSLVASDYSGSVRLWDMARRSVTAAFDTLRPGLIRHKFARDGIYWVSLSADKRARVWKKTDREAPASRLLPGGDYFVAAFSADAGYLFVGGWGGSILVWDLAADAVVRRIEVGGWVTSLATSAAGLLACGLRDGTVTILDPATPRILQSWREHTMGVSALAFSRDGRLLASGGDDSIIKIWDVPEAAGRSPRLAVAGAR